MKRTAAYQPIFLTKFKKREKENTEPFPKKMGEKQGIQYDLMLFQQSLQLQKESEKQANFTYRVEQERNPLGQTTSYMENTLRSCGDDLKEYQQQSACLKNFNSTGPVMTRMELNQNFKNMKSIHKTTSSYKPNVSKASFSKVQTSKCELDIMNLNLKEKNARYVKEKNPSFETIYEERMELMKKSYEIKIAELQKQNKQLEEQNTSFQKAALVHEQQKQLLIKRIDFLQKDVCQLFEQKKDLQVVSPKEGNRDAQIQTDLRQMEASQQIQFKPSLSYSQSPRMSLQAANENWQIKAKALKTELEWYKMHSSNQMTQFKVSLQNKQIEWRQKYQLLQKKYNSLNEQYNSKSMEVRDKQNLLKRFLVSSH